MTNQEIPKNHPRYQSLLYRKKIEAGVVEGIVASAGPIAHGRGEAFDYVLGETTLTLVAEESIPAAAAMLLLAKRPVISVNGNAAVLVASELVALADVIPAKLEVNVFYGRTEEREQKIAKVLQKAGALEVFGINPEQKIPLLESARASVSRDGIYSADVVLVMLEDGDRTEFLKKAGKNVIAVDLNPLSRTPQTADIAIIDNIVRCIPLLTTKIKELSSYTPEQILALVKVFNNKKHIQKVIRFIANRLKTLGES